MRVVIVDQRIKMETSRIDRLDQGLGSILTAAGNLLEKAKVKINPELNQVSATNLVQCGAQNQELASTVRRNELIAKLISTCVGLGVSLTITYFGFKYLANVLDPTRQEKQDAKKRAERLMQKIGVSGVKLSEYELCIASNLVDPLSMTTSFDDIGGLEDILLDVKESVILPFKRRELYTDTQLLQPPKGVLLYGPPGCGKTMIAKAMAKAAGARFINLQLSSLVDKWYGESQKRAEAVFSLAMKLQPAIIFIDEIDSFLRARTSSDHEATIMMKTQFMSFWDGLMTDNRTQILIIGATNRPQDVDAAILRRMPCMFRIGLPDHEARQHVLALILKNEHICDDVDLAEISSATDGFSGSDLRELCRNAATYRIRDYLRQEASMTEDDGDMYHLAIRPLNRADLMQSLSKIKQSKLLNLVAEQQISLD